MLYKVCVEEVNVYLHPNADNLELVAIGDSQYVVQKGLYVTGDLAVAIPKNSVVSHPVFIREWGEYLQGPDKNRVGFKLMRGQESQGIVVREDLVKEITNKHISEFEVGVDISDVLCVKQYVAPIPDELKDTVEAYTGTLKREIKHDCKYPAVYLNKFAEGELVTITSKLHGSQVNIILDPSRTACISSKGLWQQGLIFKKGLDNVYTKAYNNFANNDEVATNFINVISNYVDKENGSQLHIVGEVVPIFNGFSYGHTEPTLYIFAIYVDGVSVDLINFRHIPDINIVPELYRGAFHPIITIEISNGFAQQKVCPLDGVTPNEGVVVSNGIHHMKDKNLKFMGKHGNEEGT